MRKGRASNETYRPAYMSSQCLLSPKPDVNLKMNWCTTKKLAYVPVCSSEETFWKRSNCRRWFLVCEPAKRCFWPGLPGSTLPYWYNISLVKPQLPEVNYITVMTISIPDTKTVLKSKYIWSHDGSSLSSVLTLINRSDSIGLVTPRARNGSV